LKEQQVPGQPSNLEEGFFPVIWAQLPKKGFNIDPPSVKLFFQNRNQGGYGNPSISNLTGHGVGGAISPSGKSPFLMG